MILSIKLENSAERSTHKGNVEHVASCLGTHVRLFASQDQVEFEYSITDEGGMDLGNHSGTYNRNTNEIAVSFGTDSGLKKGKTENTTDNNIANHVIGIYNKISNIRSK